MSEFMLRLLDSGLVSRQELEATGRLLAGVDEPDEALARLLERTGRLTPYQINLVRTGKPADTVIGNYEVLDRLGAGGMGTVFKARHRRMKRIVAVKLLSSKLAADPTFVQRFQREVETIARLSHPNIVMAFDADVSEARHFLVMEFVDGRDLDSLVTRDGPLIVPAALDCIIQAAQGLEYVHGQGMMHRDIKPANLLCDAHGVVKVTDLGLARFTSTGSEINGITQAGGVVGTVDFMPPEQAVDATCIDHRADIYSLGATLYYLLTGQPPYPDTSMMGTLLKHRDAPIPSLQQARADVPAGLDAVFRRMMAKAPADRYQSMTQVIAALKAVQETLSPTAATSPPAVIVTPQQNVGTSQAGTDTSAPTLVQGAPSVGKRLAPKVVLVEPSRTQSGIIRKYLSAQGINQVVPVASGKEALIAIRAERPDAIVCALHLPDMTGVQLAQQVRSENVASPGFVLISSESDSADASSLSRCGNGIVLQKPFTPEKLAEALSLAAGPFESSAKSARDSLRVLIVDDSTPARLHIRGILKELGLSRFVEAADGAQAVSAIARDQFDLIVTDFNMPFMDGRSLAGFIKQNPATAATPIIMVTTETDPAKLEAVRQLGVTVCDKSFHPAQVQNIIEQILSAS